MADLAAQSQSGAAARRDAPSSAQSSPGGGEALVRAAAAPMANPVDSGVAALEPGRDSGGEPAAAAQARPPGWHPIPRSWFAEAGRLRTFALLGVNLALFCGLCAFTHWLRTGVPANFELGSYIEPFRFWGPQTQNLYDFLLYPVSIDHTPVHGIVIGLLLAAIVAVPISVAILFRFETALPFIAAVFLFAHLPWMAVTLTASCVLASVRPFRMKFRFGSALLGLLPVLLYLYLATRGPSDPMGAVVSPERKLLLVGPWLLAILAACTMLAAIIFIAHLVQDRPGAVLPVMAVTFATPAVLFHTYVGVDELHYRVLEKEYGPRSDRFAPVQDATDAILDLLHHWTNPAMDREPRRSALLAVWSTDPGEQAALKRRVSRRLQLDLMDQRERSNAACREFIADHPKSRYVPSVLFIQARSLDARLDERTLIGETAQRELYTDFPHVESEPVWTNLLTAYPDSALAVAARVRVAQLRLRKGDVEGALALLSLSWAGGGLATPTQPSRRPILSTTPPESTLEYDPEQDAFESQRWRELISANRDDPRYGNEPLKGLACLDPHREGYREQLLRLLARYPDCLLADNILADWASAAADRERRAALLLAVVLAHPDGDAAPAATFELADLEVQALGTANAARRAAGIARFRTLAAEHAQTCWGLMAAERLRMLDPQPAAETRAAVEGA